MEIAGHALSKKCWELPLMNYTQLKKLLLGIITSELLLVLNVRVKNYSRRIDVCVPSKKYW
jgi:hypothetical protein